MKLHNLVATEGDEAGNNAVFSNKPKNEIC